MEGTEDVMKLLLQRKRAHDVRMGKDEHVEHSDGLMSVQIFIHDAT